MQAERKAGAARAEIHLDRLTLRSLHVWAEHWFLLTAGDFAGGDFNTMTVSWGSFGTVWNRPFAQVFVRPTRHTYSLLERYDTFTLSSFAAEYREALMLLGTKSGRDGDKIAESGLTPMASRRVAAPCFAEADLVIECRTMYRQDVDPGGFLDPSIEENYPARDYHRVYFGEILRAACAPELRR